jgi:signal transduction histidine kinase
LGAQELNGHAIRHPVVEHPWPRGGQGAAAGPPPEATPFPGEFLAQLSHELRTPLNAVIGFSEIIQAGRAGPVTPSQKEFLDDVLASSRRLLQLIDDVLDLAHVATGRIELAPEPIDLPTLIAEVAENLGALAAEKEMQVEIAVDAAAREVRADRSRLRQVLSQYLSNALKFTPARGRVVVQVRAVEPDAFELAVEDNGKGIRPEDLDRLFVPFQQLDPKLARQYPGTGLGLALTRQIVEVLGGRVGVASEVGRGSRFFAVLPRHPAPRATD